MPCKSPNAAVYSVVHRRECIRSAGRAAPISNRYIRQSSKRTVFQPAKRTPEFDGRWSMFSQADSRFLINLEQQRKRAKDLRRAHQEGSMEAAVRIARHLPRARNLSPETILASPFPLSEAQFVVAREAGFLSWPIMKRSEERRVGKEC